MFEDQEQRLIAFITHSVLEVEDGTHRINADTLLFRERLLNSMNILDLIGYVEQHVGRRLEDEEIVMANFESVRAITRTFLIERNDAASLDAAGFQSAAGGGVLLAGAAARLYEAWLRYLRRLLKPFADTSVQAPLFISRRVLVDAGYLQHFPQQPFRCCDPSGTDEQYVTPAACFHLYPLWTGQTLNDGPTSALILARCARHEGGEWTFPFRLADFHMLELVVVGEHSVVARRRREVETLIGTAFDALGLTGIFEPATDAFFLGNDEGARIMQRLKRLKLEYVVPFGDERVAIASINDHEDYFGKCFDVRLSDGHERASSFCAAFGLERLTAAGLLTWGAAATGWPKELQR